MSDRYSRILAQKKKNQNEEQRPEIDEVINSSFDAKTDQIIDPRPDLKNDHFMWVNLLTNAKEMFPAFINETPFWGALLGIRSGGARLAKTDTGTLKLLPGEFLPEKWEDIKTQWLAPIKDELIKLLQITSLGRKIDGEWPGGKPEQTSLKNAWMER